MRLTAALIAAITISCTLACAQDEHPGWEPEPGDLDPEQNIALGKTVTYAPSPDYRLTAEGDTDPTDLTDGELSDHHRGHLWFQSKCVGWSYGGRANLSLDLGQVEPIREIAIRIQGGSPSSGICTPVWMAAVVSDDGENWRRVGEYSTFDWSDDAELNVPRYEGEGWVHRFRFDDLEARGRYVGISLYGTGVTVGDEMYVFRGDHDPDACDMAVFPAMDFSVERPQMYLHKPYLCFTTNVTTPNPVGLVAPEGFEEEDVVVTLELPPGVELIDGGGFGRGEEAAPMAELAGEAIEDGWTRYEFAGTAAGNTKTWGRLFISGDWEDGQEGEMRYHLSYADGTQAPIAAIPLRAIEVPQTPQPEGLIAGLSWYGVGAMMSWPDSIDAFEHLGFNTVTNFVHWIADRSDEGEIAQWEFWEQCREAGFGLLQIDSTFHRMTKADEIYCQFEDGTHGNRICPSYRGEHYQDELDRVSEQAAMAAPDYLFCDIEIWNWRGPVDSEDCVRCQADFEQSEFETLEEWKLQQGYEMWTDVVTAVDAGLAGAGEEPVEYGVYDWVPGHNYQFTWPFDRLYPDYLQSAQPSTYTPLYWYHIELVGDEVRESRAQLPRPDVLPWISPGDAGTFDGDRLRYALLECFVNGSRGMNFWSGRVWDAENLAAYSRTIRNLQPVEDILLAGGLLEGAQVQTAGRISGVTADGEMVILVADYFRDADGPVTVTLPVEGAMTAEDLDTGEEIRVDDSGELVVPLEDVRARVFHVR
jgi:hypothetical protein